jgi:hypothetical protein
MQGTVNRHLRFNKFKRIVKVEMVLEDIGEEKQDNVISNPGKVMP